MRRVVLSIFLSLFLFGCGGKKTATPKTPQPEPWRIVSYSTDGAPAYLSNGYLGVRVGPSGFGLNNENKSYPAFIADIYENGDIVTVPNWFAVNISVNHTELNPTKSDDYEQVLELNTGILKTSWTQKAGNAVVKIKVETWVSRAENHYAGFKVNIQSSKNSVLSVSYSPNEIPNTPYKLEKPKNPDTVHRFIHSDNSPSIEYKSEFEFGKQGAMSPKIPQNETLYKNQEYTLSCLYHIKSDIPPKSNALTLKSKANFFPVSYPANYDNCLKSHTEAWSKLWQSDIKIEGDIASQQMVRTWLFYLYSSSNLDGRSLPPMGLSSNLYKGHIFWDADIWMLPSLQLLQPEFADSMILYRLNTLEAANANATRSGNRGARYPWEGDRDGVERAPGEFQEQLHITADVANAAANHILYSSGEFREIEIKLLRETADYWISRLEFDSASDEYLIKQAMGPDESGLVNNDLYTAVMVKNNLMNAYLLCEDPNPKWRIAAEKLRLPKDEVNNIYLTYDEDTQKSYKQAAALLALYPGELDIPLEKQRKMLDFYAPKTSKNGPAMSHAIYTILACRLNDPQKSWEYFKLGYEPYLRQPFNLFNETQKSTSDKTYFLTGCGGNLQAILFGFAGINIHNKGKLKSWQDKEGKRLSTQKLLDNETLLTITPSLPPSWKSLEVSNVHIQGKIFNLRISKSDIHIESVQN